MGLSAGGLRLCVHPALDFVCAAVEDGAGDGDEESDEADEGVLDDVGVDFGKSLVSAKHRGDGCHHDSRHQKAHPNDRTQKTKTPVNRGRISKYQNDLFIDTVSIFRVCNSFFDHPIFDGEHHFS